MTGRSAEDHNLSRALHKASFRDPGGVLLFPDDRVLRIVNSAASEDVLAFLKLDRVQQLVDTGQVVRSRLLDRAALAMFLPESTLATVFDNARGGIALEHERIAFPSFPYEWPSEMLHAAAVLTIDLAAGLLNDGFCLKDATPLNVLFRGPKPVFVDLLSFERRAPHDPTWLPYAQFVRTFLLPLLLQKSLGLATHETLSMRRDGLQPEDVYQLLPPLQRIRPPWLTLVSIPKWLSTSQKSGDSELYSRRRLQDPEKARFVLTTLFRNLLKTLRKLGTQPPQHSAWSAYMQSFPSYTPAQFAAKESLVRKAYEESSPRWVLDVGCNTGHFSVLAARKGARVVAIDSDPVVAGRLWRVAHSENFDILPLVVNLGWPTPSIGWENLEFSSFLERARGHFDFVLMLAVIHHFLITERVPLRKILSLVFQLTSNWALIEYVGREDPMFRKLLRGRDHLHADWSMGYFESECSRLFEIVRSEPIPDSFRRLYLLKRRTSPE